MKSKTLTLALIVALSLVTLVSALAPVSAWSEQATGLTFYGFDNNKQTNALVGGFTVFAADNKLLFYDDDAQLVKTWTPPAFVCGAGARYFYNSSSTRTVILPVNSSFLLFASVMASAQSQNPYVLEVMFNIGLLNAGNLGYTSINSSYYATPATYSHESSTIVPVAGSGLILLTHSNATGTFYYMSASVYLNELRWYSSAFTDTQPAVSCGLLSYIGYYAAGGSSFSSAYAVKVVSGASAITYPASVQIDNAAGTAEIYYVGCNGFYDSVKGLVWKYDLAANTLVQYATSALDNDYTGNKLTTASGAVTVTVGFEYVIGQYYYSSGGSYLYQLNHVFSYLSASQFGACTLKFNSTHISDSNKVGLGSVNSDSTIVRPFAVMPPYGSSGNTSGLYTFAFWTNTVTNDLLTGYSYDLAGIEQGEPVWSVHQVGFMFTPQQPQTFNYTTSTNFGGCQPYGSNVGLEVDFVSGSAVANLFYGLSNIHTFNGLLQGGIYTNPTAIAQYPTLVQLQQSVSYSYYGYIYLYGVQGGSGNYTIYSTGLSTLSNVASAGVYSVVGSSPTGNIVSGTFSFTFSQRVSSYSVMYEGVIIQVLLSDGSAFNVTYNFGWYKLGAAGSDGLVPYPSQTPIDGSDGGSGAIDSNINLFGNVLVPLGLILGIPALLALLLAMLHAGEQIVIIAFFVGLVICFCLAVVTGIVPFWTVYLLAVVLALVAIVVFSRFFRG